MNMNLKETVQCEEAPEAVWLRLLEPSAVTGFLGVEDDVKPFVGTKTGTSTGTSTGPSPGSGINAAEESAHDSTTSPAGASVGFRGHTFRIVGLGGGLYHAECLRAAEPVMLEFALWRDDTPDTVGLLTFELEPLGDGAHLTVHFAADLPIEQVFGAVGSLVGPLIEPLATTYMAHRLRQHLRTITSTVSSDRR